MSWVVSHASHCTCNVCLKDRLAPHQVNVCVPCREWCKVQTVQGSLWNLCHLEVSVLVYSSERFRVHCVISVCHLEVSVLVHSSEQCRVHCVISVRRSSTAEVHTSASHTPCRPFLFRSTTSHLHVAVKKKRKKREVFSNSVYPGK